MNTVYLNGQFLPKSEARLSVDERGFFFGDGVYEVTRVIRGRLFEWDRHAERLTRGLKELRIPAPFTMDELHALQARLIEENAMTEGQGTIYLQVTRGAAPRVHHFPPAGTAPTVFMTARPFTPNNEQRSTGVSAVTYPDYRWTRCDLKTVNLLPAVMANQFAKDHQAYEAIFVREAAVTEGSHTNVFGVVEGVLRTFPNCNFVLPGVTRDVLVEIAHELDVPVRETPIFVHEIPSLQELFLTGTTTDVMPVVTLDGKPVGTGRPGPIAARLYEALAARLSAVASAAPAAGAR